MAFVMKFPFPVVLNSPTFAEPLCAPFSPTAKSFGPPFSALAFPLFPLVNQKLIAFRFIDTP